MLELTGDRVDDSGSLVHLGRDLDSGALPRQLFKAAPVVLGWQVGAKVIARLQSPTKHPAPVHWRSADHVELVPVACEMVLGLGSKRVPDAAIDALEDGANRRRVTTVAPRSRLGRDRRRAATSFGVRRASAATAIATSDAARDRERRLARTCALLGSLRGAHLFFDATLDVAQSASRFVGGVVAGHTSRRRQRWFRSLGSGRCLRRSLVFGVLLDGRHCKRKGVSNPFTIGGNPWTCGRQQCLETCEKRGSTSTTYSQQWHDRGSLCAFANLKRVTPAQVTTSCLQTNVRPKREFYRLNVGWAAEEGRINTRSHEPVAARCRTATELTESQQGVQWPTTSRSD